MDHVDHQDDSRVEVQNYEYMTGEQQTDMTEKAGTGLALFDFDGTITTKDSLGEFIRYAVGKRAYYAGLARLSPVLGAYVLKLLPNDLAKERMITYFFRGWEAARFRELAKEYALKKMECIIRPKALERIRWHQHRGDRVVVVSASMQCWLLPWCQKEGVELLATQLLVRQGKITGKFGTENCYGREKAVRVRTALDLSVYQVIYAYGDSSGDRELLELANRRFYKPFRD